MKNFGIVLIIAGILSIVLSFFAVAGGGAASLPLLGLFLVLAGFFLYRRHRMVKT